MILTFITRTFVKFYIILILDDGDKGMEGGGLDYDEAAGRVVAWGLAREAWRGLPPCVI